MSDNPHPWHERHERSVPLPDVCHAVLGIYTREPLEREDVWEPLPEPLLRRFGAADNTLAALADRPHVRLIHSAAPTEAAASATLRARQESLALAAEHDAVVVDLAIPRVLSDAVPDLSVASQWVAFDIAFDTLESIGLAQFGLPEIAWSGDTSNAAPVLAVLTGLAHRLISEWPDHDPVGPATVTLSDIAQGYGDAGHAPRDQGIELTISYDGTHLVVSSDQDPASLFN